MWLPTRAIARILKLPSIFERVLVQNGLKWSKHWLKWYEMVQNCHSLPVKNGSSPQNDEQDGFYLRPCCQLGIFWRLLHLCSLEWLACLKNILTGFSLALNQLGEGTQKVKDLRLYFDLIQWFVCFCVCGWVGVCGVCVFVLFWFVLFFLLMEAPGSMMEVCVSSI